MAEDLLCRAELQELALAHHGDGVGQNERLFLIVGHEDGGGAGGELDAANLGAQLDALDAELTARTPADDAEGLALLAEYDGKIKALLTEIFGAHNDFDALLEGVSLAAVGQNGKRVVQNLLEALTPVLQAGAEQHLQAVADAAAAEADAARVQRQSL